MPGNVHFYSILKSTFFEQDMMRYLNWTRAAILYEDEFGLVRLQDLVRTPPTKNLEL